MNNGTLKPCKDARNNCFAQTPRRNCTCLENTNFPNYDNVCPFYKTVEQYQEGVKKYGSYHIK